MDRRGDVTAVTGIRAERRSSLLSARLLEERNAIRTESTEAPRREIARGPPRPRAAKICKAPPEDAIVWSQMRRPSEPKHLAPSQWAEPQLPALADSGGPSVPNPSEMALLDADGVIVSVNGAWREAVQAAHPELRGDGIGQRYVDLWRSMLSEGGAQAMHMGLKELASGRSKEFAQVYVVSTPTGLLWRQQRIVSVPSPWTGFIASHEDITDLEYARAALRSTPDQLLWVQEQERQRIAIELHDSTGQHLVALGLGIRRLRRLASDSQGIADVLEDMTASVREAVREIRVLSYLSQHSSLDRMGLQAAIRHCVAGFMARSELETTFEAAGAVDEASGPTQHAVLRIVQEALSNAYRHAEASRVDVRIARSGDTLSLKVSDNGKGMSDLGDNGADGGTAGVGLISMRARVASLKGRLTIASGATGVSIEALLPLHPATH